MTRTFLAAVLVDHRHVVHVPVLLGRGVRLCDVLEALEHAEAAGHRRIQPIALSRDFCSC